MQRKLAATAIKLHQLLIPSSSQQPRFLAACRTDSRSVGRTADPKIHNEDPQETYDVSGPSIPATSTDTSGKDDDHYVPTPKNPPFQSNPRIERPAVTPPPNPFTQQKRPNSNSSTQARNEDIICVGLDGSPFPEDEKRSGHRGRNRRNEEEEEDDHKDYFKHHKASPLSELEIADTRKPVTKATDGTAGDYGGGGGGGVVLWRPEQIDTAEDSLRRAMEIWKQNAIRGDPDSPHGRVLRSLRGEYW